MLDELDYVERQQALDAQIKAEEMFNKQKSRNRKISQTQKIESDKFIYDKVQVMNKLFLKFDEKSKGYQEKSQEQAKIKFKYDLTNIKKYDLKNQFVDRQIEFDQRFFTAGYKEFQLMVSDVRKQIQLNEAILRLRSAIDQIKKQDAELHRHNLDTSHNHDHDELLERHADLLQQKEEFQYG